MASWHIAGPAGTTTSASAIVFLVLLGVVASGVSTMVFVWMVLRKGPLFAGMTTYVVPVLALLWGTLDSESISPMQATAIVGVLVMVALVQTGTKRASEVVEPAAAGDMVTSLPISAEAEAKHLVALPVAEISFADKRATQPESQVA